MLRLPTLCARPNFHFTAAIRVSGTIVGLWCLLVAGPVALAVGPNYQTVNDTTAPNFTGAPSGTLNDVVSLSSKDGVEGTGTVIGITQPVGTVYTVSILTANHVANEGITTANFGLAGNVLQMQLTGKSVTYTLTDANNTKNLPEDLTIVQATVDTAALVGNANRLAEFNLVRANVPTLSAFAVAVPASNPSGTNIPDLTIKAATQSFTEYGYGNQGTYDPTAPAHFTNGAAGTRMFENNVTSALLGANDSLDSDYFQPYGIFTAKSPSIVAGVAPANPTSNGQGTSTTGDSGGPLMFATAGPTVTVTPNWGPAAQMVPTDVPLNFTNNLAAVVQSVTLASMNPGVVNVGSQNFAVPLVGGAGGSLAWAQTFANNPYFVPEPSTFVLVAMAAVGLLLFGRQKRRPALATGSPRPRGYQ